MKEIKETKELRGRKPLFSILIPTWNNLEYLKLCIASIFKNSSFQHQIIVHVNEGTDGTLEWVKEQGVDFTYSEQNIGVCFAMNTMRRKVTTDYIFFVNDDMYLLPNWDVALWNEICSLEGNSFFYLSSSIIQPFTPPKRGMGLLRNYGNRPDNFQEESLLNDCQSFSVGDWQGATRPPCLVNKDVWDLVGGYSIELTPGMGSDPDFTAKLYFAGVRHFKGLGDSWAYHFESKSTKKVAKNDYLPQFLFKWGITNSGMHKHITRLGQPWGNPHDIGNRHGLFNEKMRGHLKCIYYALIRKYGPVKSLGNDR